MSVFRATMLIVTTLVERGAQLDVLRAAAERVVPGAGAVALVTGEAGIGKTALVRAFAADLAPHWAVLSGGCDDLLTPRPLGPLRDVARDGPPALRAALADGSRDDLLEALLACLAGERPTLLLIEDVHWADDATIDALRQLTRRLDRVHALVVLTCRPDDVAPGHPLQALLGDLARAAAARIPLPRLTSAGIAALGSVDAEAVLTSTGGNPFFVTEVLAAPDAEVPATVVDAVLARLHQLDPAAQRALEQLAVVPTHVGLELAVALLGGLDALAEPERRGIVTVVDGAIAFRHELARRAVERSLPLIRRIELNRAAVEVLRNRDDPDLPLLVHHAVQAGDLDTILGSGPAAAREAAAASAHRQALAHYAAVVRHAQRLGAAERATLFEEYAAELYIAHRFADSARVTADAVALRRELGEDGELVRALVALSRNRWMTQEQESAWAALDEAETVAARSGDVASAALVGAHRLTLLLLGDSAAAVLEAAPEAIARAREAGRADLLAICLNYTGSAQVLRGDESGLTALRESLAIAVDLGAEDLAGRAYNNLAYSLWMLTWMDELDATVDEALAYSAVRDLSSHGFNQRCTQAEALLLRGRYDEAAARLDALHADVEDPGRLGEVPKRLSGVLLARRGLPGAEQWLAPLLAEALQQPDRVLGRRAGDARALVEWCWLDDRVEVCRPLADALVAVGSPDLDAAELVRWLLRAGLIDRDAVTPLPGLPEAHAAGWRGDWRAAADAWKRVGAPYERALELLDSGEVDATLEGIAVLDALGAAPAARIGRQRLRDLGVARVPRGPVPTTRANPGGLTERQLDVLALLAEGLTNGEIAARLVVSPRTVDHHVSAVLAKLGVTTRREAARRARELRDG